MCKNKVVNAGKTTLMKCILGYLRHKGVVTLDGETTIYRMEEASLAQLLTIAETGL